jgi:glycosyltransferase involved in cell wall biosynthesis
MPRADEASTTLLAPVRHRNFIFTTSVVTPRAGNKRDRGVAIENGSPPVWNTSMQTPERMNDPVALVGCAGPRAEVIGRGALLDDNLSGRTVGGSGPVLIVTKWFSLGYGGMPESIILLANYFEEVGVRADVLCTHGFYEDVGKLHALPEQKAPLGLRQVVGLDLSPYASIFVVGSWNPSAFIVACRAKRANVPVIYSAKGALARAEFKRFRDVKKPLYLVTIEFALLLMADRLVFSSALEQRSMILPPRWFAEKSVVVPEPFRGGPLDQVGVERDAGTLRFGFLAEVAPRKGLAELVEGFLAWCDHASPRAELHIAGEPRPGSENYLARIQAMVRDSVHADKVMWRGAARGAERDRFYSDIDVFVCPSLFESFGLTPLEAMWHGLPVIANSQLGVLEFLTNKAPVLVLPGLAKSDFAAAFDEILRNRAAWASRGRGHRGILIPSLSGRALISRFTAVLGRPPCA